MTSFSTQLKTTVKKREVKARNVAVNSVRTIGFSVIEVLAAMNLHGWLSIALYAIVAYRVLVLAIAIAVLTVIGADALNDALNSDPRRDGWLQR